jgi:hypothetical protein
MDGGGGGRGLLIRVGVAEAPREDHLLIVHEGQGERGDLLVLELVEDEALQAKGGVRVVGAGGDLHPLGGTCVGRGGADGQPADEPQGHDAEGGDGGVRSHGCPIQHLLRS